MRNGPETTSDSPTIVKLHTPEGRPLYVRRDFMISAMAPREGITTHTKVAIDNRHEIKNVFVMEALTDIKGPFAEIGDWLKINPAYFVSVVPREDGSHRDIFMHSPSPLSFFTSSQSTEEILEAVQTAWNKGPC